MIRRRPRRRLQHQRTLLAPPSDPPSPNDRIGALAWTTLTGAGGSGVEQQQQQAELAVPVVGAGGRPTVHLYDSEGRRVDRIPLKPAVKDGPKDFGVTALAFSPNHDGGAQKLAVAQTDSIVYVYRLGERKSICHKFPVPELAQLSGGIPVTCLVWPASQPHALFFGLADGRIVAGHCRSNDVTTLYQAEAGATALSVDPQGQALVSAHRDGSLWRVLVPDGPSSAEHPTPIPIARHLSVPIGLAYSAEAALLVVGTDGQVRVYDPRDGRVLQAFDGGGVCRSVAVQGPLLALGGLDSIRLFEQQGAATLGRWQGVGTYTVPGLHLATGLAWRPDGRQLAVGLLCGALDLLDLVEENTHAASSAPTSSMAAPTAAGATSDAALFQRARALGYEQGIQLLQAHGRLEAAVDAALDSGNFEYALRVCDLSLPRRLPEAHGRHARHLEAEEKYAEASMALAEAAFLRARDLQGAIDMQLRLGDHAAARRLAQSHAPAALPAVLAAEASALIGQQGQAGDGEEEEARLAQAEALYVTAGQPEQALQQYVEAKAWAGAFRVAQRHCRGRLGDVVAAYEEGRSPDGGGGRHQHHDDALTRTYGRRVDGAQHDRYLGQQLRALEIVGGELQGWSAAWAMVRVEEEREGANGASAKRARDRLVCVQLRHLIATAAGGEEPGSTLVLLGSALVLLQEKGAPCPVAEPMAVDVYKRLVTRLLGLTLEEETAPEGVDAIRAWHRLLHAVLVEQVDRRMLRGAAATTTLLGEEERPAHEFRDLFLALHHTHVLLACSAHPSLGAVAARAALAALRYAGTLLPADKAFYRAGMALCQHAESLADAQAEEEGPTACRHLAFPCLNRYIDLVEAIADQDPSLIDPRPLAGCTALPAPSPSGLPTRQHVAEEGAREAVRTWVLGACVDMAGQELRREDGGGLAEALFATPPAHERCAVTGCPLQGPTTVVVAGAGKVEAPGTAVGAWQPITRANTGAWRAYVEVFKECPWTGKAIK